MIFKTRRNWLQPKFRFGNSRGATFSILRKLVEGSYPKHHSWLFTLIPRTVITSHVYVTFAVISQSAGHRYLQAFAQHVLVWSLQNNHSVVLKKGCVNAVPTPNKKDCTK